MLIKTTVVIHVKSKLIVLKLDIAKSNSVENYSITIYSTIDNGQLVLFREH